MPARERFEHHLLALLQQRPAVDAQAVQALLDICRAQIAASSPPTRHLFWRLTAQFFEGLAHSPNPSLDLPHAAFTAHLLQGLRLQHDAAGLQALNPVLFLEQADALLGDLQRGLQAATDADGWPIDVSGIAQRLLTLTQEMDLVALADLVRALRSQLERVQLARLQSQPSESDLAVSWRGVQEIHRSLHQFAAGATPQPDASVRLALDASA